LPIVSVPVRAAPGLAATENVMEPLPEPLDGLVRTMNPSLLIAAQLQTPAVVMLTVELPPLPLTATLAGESTREHKPPPALNDSTRENALVSVPLVARARQE